MCHVLHALTGAAAGRMAETWGREPMAALINELDELSAALLIVLDDYQHVASPATHEAVQFLLDHMPSACRLILLTREDPPLAMVLTAPITRRRLSVPRYLSSENGQGEQPNVLLKRR